MGFLEAEVPQFGGRFFNTARKIPFLSINTAVSRKDNGNPQRTWNSSNSVETIILFDLSVNFDFHLYSEIPQC